MVVQMLYKSFVFAGMAWRITHTMHGFNSFMSREGGGLRVVFSTAAIHARVRDSFPGPGGSNETYISSPPTRKTQYCGEPPWPKGSVLGVRPPGFAFRILCVEGSVISLISLSSGGSPDPI